MFSHWLFPDDENDDLPAEAKERAYILLPSLDALMDGQWSSRNREGKINHFQRVGAVSDLLDWFGMDALPGDIVRIVRRIDGEGMDSAIAYAKELAIERLLDAPYAAVNKLAQGVTPIVKSSMELITKKRLWPSIFEPRPQRLGVGEYMANLWGLRPEYQHLSALADGDATPLRSYADSFEGILSYHSDPQQAAYYDLKSKQAKFAESIGKDGDFGGEFNGRTQALHNARLAVRYGDKEDAARWVSKYFDAGGTLSGMRNTFYNMAPEHGFGLSKVEQAEFIDSLGPQDRYTYAMARLYFINVLMGDGPDRLVYDHFDVLAKKIDRTSYRTAIARYRGAAVGFRSQGKETVALELERMADTYIEEAGGWDALVGSWDGKERKSYVSLLRRTARKVARNKEEKGMEHPYNLDAVIGAEDDEEEEAY